jgi:UDP-2,4-diacetamido-2,4,6-trideoxy-beta-L-altropyranose hydrolase
MKVIFRADSSLDIGTGHVMRCLTLADALRVQGAQCAFVCREHPGNLHDLIQARGHAIHTLPLVAKVGRSVSATGYAGWLGADWATDAEQTVAAIGGPAVDWLIVDHYALDARWEKLAGTASRHLMVIDDLADRSHDCDLLLDQNLNRQIGDYAGLIPLHCKIFIGPMFALLQQRFTTLRDYSIRRREENKLAHILVSMGGIDKDNLTGKVLNALNHLPLPSSCQITVVLGANAPWISIVQLQAANMLSTKVLINVQDMAQLMADSDLAIGAAGSSAWERCCLGLPTLMLVMAENQREAATSIERAGAAFAIDSGENLQSELSSQIATLIKDKNLMKNLTKNALNVTSGHGCAIMVKALMEYQK